MLAHANYRSFTGLDRLLDYFVLISNFLAFLTGLFSKKI
jgi:hypothetical protein